MSGLPSQRREPIRYPRLRLRCCDRKPARLPIVPGSPPATAGCPRLRGTHGSPVWAAHPISTRRRRLPRLGGRWWSTCQDDGCVLAQQAGAAAASRSSRPGWALLSPFVGARLRIGTETSDVGVGSAGNAVEDSEADATVSRDAVHGRGCGARTGAAQPEIHRVDPESGSTLRLL